MPLFLVVNCLLRIPWCKDCRWSCAFLSPMVLLSMTPRRRLKRRVTLKYRHHPNHLIGSLIFHLDLSLQIDVLTLMPSRRKMIPTGTIITCTSKVFVREATRQQANHGERQARTWREASTRGSPHGNCVHWHIHGIFLRNDLTWLRQTNVYCWLRSNMRICTSGLLSSWCESGWIASFFFANVTEHVFH